MDQPRNLLKFIILWMLCNTEYTIRRPLGRGATKLGSTSCIPYRCPLLTSFSVMRLLLIILSIQSDVYGFLILK